MKNTFKKENSGYKVILRHAKGWQNYKVARIHISLPPDPVFDPRARCILEWATSNFDHTTLYLHDTIQRYNYMATGLTEAEGCETAINAGDIWLKQNIYAPDVFIDVVRWNQLLAHPAYAASKQRVYELYHSNSQFADAVDHDLNSFAERCKNRGESFTNERRGLSWAFLLEEIAGYVPLFRETSAADIHPGMRMKAMQLLQEGLGNFGFKDNLMVAIKTFEKTTHAEHVPHETTSMLCSNDLLRTAC